ncbi:MAG: urease subunit beta [Nitrosomonadaceae bacterium]|nr:urease subunit beta [Nitrosomonadaceae bacterium]|tara:strand:+ start:3360 stop:3728 length:369 start_codon:yes stop_codon:yes gene_type:complete
MTPGEVIVGEGNIVCNANRKTVKVKATNTGDRPVQIGSHFHFFEVNRAISFNREDAIGMRLNIPASTAVRFEPGEEKEVELVEIGGARAAFGHNDLVNGSTTEDANKKEAMQLLRSKNFKDK